MSNHSKSPEPTRGISVRWLLIVTTSFIVILTVAPSLQRYFAQRAQINALHNQINDANNALEEAKKELGDEELANMYAGQNIQEKFAATMEKVKEIFISLAEPLLPVLEIFTDIFKIVGPIVGLIGKMVHYLAIATKYVGVAVAGFYTLKFLGDSVYRTTVLTNLVKKTGIASDRIQLLLAKQKEIAEESIARLKNQLGEGGTSRPDPLGIR